MGCDGGTIPRRDELVRTKKKKETKDKEAEMAAKWKYCAISSKDLQPPIVSCELGRLYNKDAVIEYLLNKESPNSSLLSHIRNLKDLVTLRLTPKPTDDQNKSTESNGANEYKYVCPIVGLEMNGNYKFMYFRQCGCVVSERAIKEVKSQVCLSCNKPFTDDDLIVLNGDDDEIEDLKNRMTIRRNKVKEEKKRKRTINNEDSTNGKAKMAKSDEPLPELQQILLPLQWLKHHHYPYYPNATEAYKSLFTSHESAKNRPKAHWVTFNPCYN
ncbi:Protein RTF2 [Dermatophagoides pteronyssinus]|uniref:Replication termination factor 2 n=1 Tax=Dermatophagoides pteronyssinus TaxID=6956 RepID=A0ABQ8JI41_DERPT|nr:Protein RTF2 [Dermatophagoides pteronyssinus]